MEEEYYILNGKAYGLTDLKKKYGANLEAKIQEHGFERGHMINDKLFPESALKEKYGDEWQTRLESLKKKDNTEASGNGSQTAGEESPAGGGEFRAPLNPDFKPFPFRTQNQFSIQIPESTDDYLVDARSKAEQDLAETENLLQKDQEMMKYYPDIVKKRPEGISDEQYVEALTIGGKQADERLSALKSAMDDVEHTIGGNIPREEADAMAKHYSELAEQYNQVLASKEALNNTEYWTKREMGGYGAYLGDKLLEGGASIARAGTRAFGYMVAVITPGVSVDEFMDNMGFDAPAMKETTDEMLAPIKSDNAPEYTAATDEDIIKGGIGGAVQTLPGMFTPFMAGMAAQIYDGAMQDIESTEEGKNLSEFEKNAYGVAQTSVGLVLEKIGLSKVLKGTPAFTRQVYAKLTNQVIKEAGEGASKEAIDQVTRKVFADFQRGVVTGGERFVNSYLAEFETGSLQEVADISGKLIMNQLYDDGGKPMFDDLPKSKGEFIEQVGKAGMMEGVGGLALGGPSAIVAGVKDAKAQPLSQQLTEMDENKFTRFAISANMNDFLTHLRTDLDIKVEKGEITEKDANNKFNVASDIVGAINSVPADVDVKQRQKYASMIMQIHELKQQGEKALDPTIYDQKIKDIKSQMAEEMAPESSSSVDDQPEDLTQPIRTEQDVAAERDALVAEIQAEREARGINVDVDLFDDLPSSVITTMDRVDDNKPVSPTAIDEASNYLYKKYKEYSKMKSDPNRMLTIEQIDAVMGQLEADVTNLENFKNEQRTSTETRTDKKPVGKSTIKSTESNVQKIENEKKGASGAEPAKVEVPKGENRTEAGISKQVGKGESVDNGKQKPEGDSQGKTSKPIQKSKLNQAKYDKESKSMTIKNIDGNDVTGEVYQSEGMNTPFVLSQREGELGYDMYDSVTGMKVAATSAFDRDQAILDIESQIDGKKEKLNEVIERAILEPRSPQTKRSALNEIPEEVMPSVNPVHTPEQVERLNAIADEMESTEGMESYSNYFRNESKRKTGKPRTDEEIEKAYQSRLKTREYNEQKKKDAESASKEIKMPTEEFVRDFAGNSVSTDDIMRSEKIARTANKDNGLVGADEVNGVLVDAHNLNKEDERILSGHGKADEGRAKAMRQAIVSKLKSLDDYAAGKITIDELKAQEREATRILNSYSKEKKEAKSVDEKAKTNAIQFFVDEFNLTESEVAEDVFVGTINRDVEVAFKKTDDLRIVHIESIRVPELMRGMGLAKEAMKTIAEFADKNGVALTLMVVPESDGITEDGLRKLYEGFGFESNGEKSMIRMPNAAKENVDAQPDAKKVVKQPEPLVLDFPTAENYADNADYLANQKRYQDGKQIRGRKKTMALPNGEKVTGQYVVVEASNIHPSHNEKTFAKTKGVPVNKDGSTLNDRDYEKDKAAQQAMIQRSSAYDRQAIQNVPVVNVDGVVESGNDRTMARRLAAEQKSDADYLAAMSEDAEMFGIDIKKVEGMKAPILVFEREGEPSYSTATYAKYNKKSEKSKSLLEKAVELSKTLSGESISRLAGIAEEVNSLTKSQVTKPIAAKIRKVLLDEGVIQQGEVAEYFDNDGALSDSGVDLVNTVLMASVFPEQALRQLSKDGMKKVRNDLMASAIDLLKNSQYADFNVMDLVVGAIDLENDIVSAGSNLQDHIGQTKMFDQKQYHENVVMFNMIIKSGRDGIKKALKSINGYAETYDSNQENLFGEKTTPEQVVAKFKQDIKSTLNEEEREIFDKAARLYAGNDTKQRGEQSPQGQRNDRQDVVPKEVYPEPELRDRSRPTDSGGTGPGIPARRIEVEPSSAKQKRPALVYKNQESLPEPDHQLEGYENLDEHQKLAVKLAIDRFTKGGKGFLLADGTGLGKTIEELVIAQEYLRKFDKPVLIVTLNEQVKENFERDAKIAGVDVSKIEIITFSGMKSKVKNNDNVEYGLVVFDEAHKMKNDGSQTAIAGFNIKADHKVFATATPMDRATGAAYFVPEVSNMTEEEVYSFLGFKIEYKKNDQTGEITRTVMLEKGADPSKVAVRIAALRDKLIAEGTMVRREYPFFGTVETVNMGLTESQMEEESDLADYWDSREEDATNDNGSINPMKLANIRMQRVGEMSRWNENNKIEFAFREAMKEIEEGRAVVIFAERVNETTVKGLEEKVLPGALSVLKEKFAAEGIEVAEIFGDKDKGKDVDKFQSGKVKVALATPNSGGTGINLDDTIGDSPRTMIMVTANYSGDQFEQMLGRVSRRNTASPARVKVLYNDSESDQHRKKKVDGKIRMLKAIQDGDIQEDTDQVLDGLRIQKESAPSEFQPNMTSLDLKFQDISDHAFIITGNDTKAHKDFLKSIGGKWNGKAMGWMYPSKRKEEVAKLIEKYEAGGQGGGLGSPSAMRNVENQSRFSGLLSSITARITKQASKAFPGINVVTDPSDFARAERQAEIEGGAQYQQPLIRDDVAIGWEYDTDKLARERFDISKLEKIGAGSDRTVFRLGDGKVLKIAHNARGLEQNAIEGDGFLVKSGVIPDVFERGLNYVVAQEVVPMKVADKVPIYNIDGDEIGVSTGREMLDDLNSISNNDYSNNTNEAQEVLAKYGLSDASSYNVLWGDLKRQKNWGYLDGRPVHLDAGTFAGEDMVTSHRGKAPLSDPEFRDIYYRSKRLKKQFGDKDSYAKFNRQGTNVMGFFWKGQVFINSQASPDTPIEEFGHLWIEIARQVNPSVLNKGLQLVRGSRYEQEVLSNPGYSHLSRGDGKNMITDEVLMESLAKAIADKGETMSVEKTAWQEFKDWLRVFWKQMGALLGVKSNLKLDEMTLDSFAKTVANEILDGLPITDITSQQLDDIVAGRSADKITVHNTILSERPDNWRQKLYDKGIEWLTIDRGASSDPVKFKKQAEGRIREHEFKMKTRVIKMEQAIAAKIKEVEPSDKKAYMTEVYKAINDFLTDDQITSVDFANQYGDEIAKHAAKMRYHVTSMSKLLMSSGVITNPELVAIFNEKLDVYLHRSYRKHDMADWNKRYEKFIGETEMNAIRSFIHKQLGTTRVASIRLEKTVNNDLAPVFINTSGTESRAFRITDVDAFENTLLNMGVGPVFVDQIMVSVRNNTEGSFSFEPTNSQGHVLFPVSTQMINNMIAHIVDPDSHIMENMLTGKKADVGGVGKIDLSILMKKGNIEPLIRKLMGEYMEGPVNYTKSISKMARLLELSVLEQKLIEKGDGIFISKDRTPYATVQIQPNDSINLAGMYMAPEIYNMLYGKDYRSPDNVIGTIAMLNGLTKASLTIFKADSQARNFWGAALMAIESGAINVRDFVSAVQVSTADWQGKHDVASIMSTPLFISNMATKAFGKMNKEQAQSFHAEALRYGVVDQNIDVNVINSIIEDIATNGESVINKIGRKFEDVKEVFAKPYAASDNIFKLLVWKNEIRNIKSAYPTLSDAQAKEKAAARVRNMMPTYAESSELLRFLSKNILLGTFVQFAAQRVRNKYQILKLIGEELKEGKETKNNALISSGLKRLGLFVSAQSLIPAAATTISYLMGWEDDEEEAISYFQPSYSENNLRLYTNHDTRYPEYFDMTFIDPSSNFQKTIIAYMRGDDPVDGAIDASKEFFDPYMGTEIFTEKIIELINNQDQYKDKIFDVNDAWYNKGLKSGGHIGQVLLPGFIKNAVDIGKGVVEYEESYGKVYNAMDEVMNVTLGVKKKNRDMSKPVASRMSFHRIKFDEARKLYSDKDHREASLVESMRSDETALAEANLRASEWYAYLQRDVEHAKALGFSEDELWDMMQAKYIPKWLSSLVLDGEPYPGINPETGKFFHYAE